MQRTFVILLLAISLVTPIGTQADDQSTDAFDLSHPHPVLTPQSQLMLRGAWVPGESQAIDFDHLPQVPAEYAVISDVRGDRSVPVRETTRQKADYESGGVNQHNYLVHHDGEFWAMWSDGPGVEDRVGQRVKFARSPDGLNWSEPQFLSPVPPQSGPDSPHYGTRSEAGFRYISRGFWQRDSELLALASLDEAAGFFGPSLEMHAFRLEPDDTWKDLGVISDNTINNFPPKQIASGQWMMSRRTWDYKKVGVQFLVGGTRDIDQWESYPVLGSGSELSAEEPLWWALPDGNLMALFRDNRKSGYLYRSFSTDDGRTWSRPVKTNFPDATSKIHGLQLSDGRFVLVSNPKPRKRDPMTISLSDDGKVFHTMLKLVGGRRIDYPHVLEHDGHLLIAFSGAKQTVEVLKVRISDLDGMRNACEE
ncbi:MAG: exo-alpha-sialidase [Planctomycetaceae bacterium]|nr:exo-alpha-sialidase [Planctomycetaceae bacterium]